MDLRVGGKYRFMKKLGEGAFGSTYSGINIKTNEEVAIKLVRGNLGIKFIMAINRRNLMRSSPNCSTNQSSTCSLKVKVSRTLITN